VRILTVEKLATSFVVISVLSNTW